MGCRFGLQGWAAGLGCRFGLQGGLQGGLQDRSHLKEKSRDEKVSFVGASIVAALWS